MCAVLKSAVLAVLANDALNGVVDPALLAVVEVNLSCTGAACVAAPASTGSTATAIAAAKALFAALKSDWASMFSRGGTTAVATGVANVEAFKFKTTMDSAQVPADVLAKDLGALLTGIDLYNDYKAGRTTVNRRGRGDASSFVANDGSANFSADSIVGCTLYQDANTLVEATAPANAFFIACGARCYYSRSVTGNTTVTTDWRHGFTITPNADSSFGYTTRARRRVTPCALGTCTLTSNTSVQTDSNGTPVPAFTGTVTPTVSAAFGDITNFTLVGELPAAFVRNSTALVGYKHAVTASGTQAVAAVGTVTSTLQDSIAVQDSSSLSSALLTIKPGSTFSTTAVSWDANGNQVKPGSATAVHTGGGTLSGMALNLVFNQGGAAEFEGLLSASASVWDKSGTALQPTQATLSGAMRNFAAGVTTEFFSGVLSASTTGYGNFDASLPNSASNSFGQSVQFVGKVTAPNRPVLEITFGSTHLSNSNDGVTQSASLQYRTLVNGLARTVVNATGSPDASGQIKNFSLTEASANLSMSWIDKAPTIKLMSGATLEIGTLTTATSLATFTDGTSVSLDIGL